MPSFPSMPSAFAAFIVAAFMAVCAGMAVESLFIPLWMRDKRPISRNMFSVLLLEVPSVPMHRFTSASRKAFTGAKPLPSFALLAGFVATVALHSFMIAISLSLICTQCARMALSRKPVSFKSATGVLPYFSRESFTSVRPSDRCVCLRTPYLSASLVTCS